MADVVDLLHTRRIGEVGDRVVFLHGLFGQGRNFTQAAKSLQPELQSLLVDLPNHGRSPWVDRVSYEQMADAVAETVRAEFAPEGRVHVVGHSMGGKVAMVLALRHPELVDRLVVVDIAPSSHSSGGEFEHLLGSLAAVDLAGLSRRADADAQLKGPIPNATTRGFLLQNLRADGSTFAWQANLEVLRRDLNVIGDFPRIDATFDRPVLWIAGERSDYILPEHHEAMRRYFPRTRHVTIKGAGHWVHSEEPESFVSTLTVFLAHHAEDAA
ncbi:MAG: alpha/beta fold hydrolase [Actinomycetales bacterium]|nr:MAG: alpha/beta fold hydrolase [Actinomycetales bacterium]